MADLSRVGIGPTLWCVPASATNAVATATKAAAAARQHFINGITISSSAVPAAAATVKVFDGTTVLDQFEIPTGFIGPFSVEYKHALAVTVGAACSISAGALGSGVVCTVVLRGRTEVDG